MIANDGEVPYQILLNQVFNHFTSGLDSLLNYELLSFRPNHFASGITIPIPIPITITITSMSTICFFLDDHPSN